MAHFIEISCPAKTFILGEYAVLDNGPAVLVNTSPRFVCTIGKKKEEVFQFPENSPVAQWIQNHSEDFKDVSFNWVNPYDEGGLGFSSAQFTAVYTYSLALKGNHVEDFDPKELWKSYKSLSHEGVQPSGADIISQWIGGVCIFEQNPLSFQNITLPFSDLEFKIFRTGFSLKTHQHLKELKLSSVEDLKQVAQVGVNAVEDKDEGLFLKSINEYKKLLKDKGLVHNKTLKILEEFNAIPEISASKGCGAVGADIVIIFYDKKDKEIINKKTAHLSFVADTSQLTYGVEFHETSMQEKLN